MDLFYQKMCGVTFGIMNIQVRQNNVVVLVHIAALCRSDPSKQGAASVMRLKADSDRVNEVYKELSAFATRRHTNGIYT